MLLCSQSVEWGDAFSLPTHTFDHVLFIHVNKLRMKRSGRVVIVTLQ